MSAPGTERVERGRSCTASNLSPADRNLYIYAETRNTIRVTHSDMGQKSAAEKRC
jgi:hypothetical protein